jgi:hypothetical protein
MPGLVPAIHVLREVVDGRVEPGHDGHKTTKGKGLMTTITLGGRRFALRPLTLGQLRRVLPAFARAAGLAQEEAIDAAIDILAAALERDHAAMTRDVLLGVELRPAELIASVDAIARLSGLVSEEGAASGDGPLEGTAVSAGASFTDS